MISADSEPSVDAPQAGAFPLSVPQLGLWAAEHINPGSSANVTAQYSEISGPIDVQLFERASRQVIEETEALRLRFGEVAGQPVQWVQSSGPWSLSMIDLSGKPEPYSAAVAWMKHQLAQPIDPCLGRAFRWTLLRLGPQRFVWSFQVHHLIMDGFSRNLIWRRLERVYSALASQQSVTPAELEPLQQRFAREQQYYRSASFEEDRHFFAGLLTERPVYPTLPHKPCAAAVKFHRNTTYLPESAAAGLRTAVAGASLARTFAAAAALFQRSWLGGDDIVIGLVVSARVETADRRTPCMLSNVVPLRLHLSDAMTIDELLSQSAGVIRELIKHQRYPSQALRRDLHLLPMTPDVYAVAVNFMTFDPGSTFAGHSASSHNLSNGPVANLVIGVFDPPGAAELRVDLNGNAELYDADELATHARRLNTIISQMAAAHGGCSIGALLTAVHLPNAPSEVSDLPAPLVPCPPGEEMHGVQAQRVLPQALTTRIRHLAAQIGATPLHLYLVAYLALLRVYAECDDLSVVAPVSAQGGSTRRTLHISLDPAASFRGTVAELAKGWQQLFGQQQASDDSSPVDFAFALTEASGPPQSDAQLRDRPRLSLRVVQTDAEDSLLLESPRAVLDPEMAAGLLSNLEALLQDAIERSDVRLSALSLLGPEQRARLQQWSRNERSYPAGRTVVELFSDVAQAQPEAVALIAGSRRWNYRQLDQCANAVASAMQRCGVTRGEHVPLLLPRGAALIICALGVLKLGAAYVPIDPALPNERRMRLLAGLRGRAGIGNAVPAGTFVQWLDVAVAERQEAVPPAMHASSAEDAAYVMFTSGSTGRPKGVEVPHRGIVRLVRGQDYADMGPDDSWLHMAPTSFDASTLEIWAPLLNGGRCIVVEADVPTPALLSTIISREGVRSAYFTASLFNVLVDESPECLAGLRQILIGGEALSPIHIRRAMERLPGVRLVNGYGPTENTVCTCCHIITSADVAPGRSVPIGRPIGNSTVQVLDRDGNPAPIGIPGELFTGGDGVALGYLGLPEQTQRSFVVNPATQTRGYRTGDRVRWRHDGLLEFLGRIDEQLKINGHRIEPGEIAAVLAEHSQVRRAAVVAQKTSTGESRLIAYVIPEAGSQSQDLANQLAQHLAERLPSYMTVASFIRVDELPLKPNGKLDVAALPSPTAEAATPATTPAPGALSETDEVVLALISELLSQPVSRHDNLYALGADSLALVRLVARLKSRMDIELSIGAVMKRGDVADILQLVARQRPPVANDGPEPQLGERCSPWQIWFWRLQQLDPTDATAVVFRAYRVSAPLNANLLERALRALLGRHLALRCRLVGAADAEPDIELRPEDELILLRARPFEAERLDKARRKERNRPFDLRRELPVRVTLQPDADRPGESEIWLSVHHSVYDGSSEEIFWRELSVIYRNLEAGAPASAGLPPLSATYFQLVKRQRAALDAGTLQAHEDYWQQQLSGAAGQLRLGAASTDTVGARETRHLRRNFPGELTEALRQCAREHHVSVAMLCLAAFEAMLWRWSGESEQLIALDFAGRGEELEQDQIGLFTSPVALRADLSGDPPLLELARVNRAQLGDALSHRIPFERLVGALGAGRHRLGAFRIFFGYLARSEPPTLGAASLTEVPPDLTLKHTDLRLNVEDRTDGLTVEIAGATALFSAAELARLTEAWQHCLTQFGQRPGLRLSEFDWISAADRAQLARWNATAAEYPRDQPLNRLLREQAMRTPAAVALEAGDLQLTYAELFERADALAARLRHAGVTPGSRVGLYLDRHATLPQAMLAVHEASAAYVPLDPAFPRDRLTFMIEDAGLRVIVTRRALVTELPPHAAQVICVDDELSVPPPDGGGMPADAGSVAYVLYTSGSTGKPKGVEIEHRQLVNFLCAMAQVVEMDSSDALLAVTSISFDIAGLEIWLPLLCGARLCLAGREEIVDVELLRRALARSHATMLQATPVTWRGLLASGWSGGAHFKALVGGEALPADLAQMLVSSCGDAWNLYGPTETTIWSSAWQLPETVGRVRVGAPIANTQLHVLDQQLRPLPIGAPGELFIGGDGVARGYLNRPELTAERFVADPFRGGTARMYRTGDLARWLPDGTVELLGRNDDQIKIRGHRIEAGEVEAALLRLPHVAQAAVALHRSDSGEARLIAGVVSAQGKALPSSAALRAELRQWLPEYMLPYHFLRLAALPLTPNGKVDRRSLARLSPAPQSEEAHAEAQAAAASALEASLLQHFGRSLGRTVTLDSDFFESGGDSLEALRLVSRLSQDQGMEVTSGELFLHSTPRRMAARLEELRAGAARPRHLLPLRSGASRATVVFVHPMGGHLAPYGRLVHHLGESMTLFGLEAGASQERYDSLAQRCAAYAEEIVAASTGPLVLVGYSLGGALAIEIAQQLRQAGRVVPLVLLLDAGVPRRLPRGWPKWRLRILELWRFSWHDRYTWLKDQLWRRLRAVPTADFGEAEGLVDTAEMRLLIAQALEWQPPAYGGKVHLFRASRNLRGYPNPPGASGWDKYCADLDVVSLPCNHAEILVEPQVLTIIEDVRSLLEATLRH